MFVLNRIRPADHEHHVFGRHNPVTVDLCHRHHMDLYHYSGRITRAMIVKYILVPYFWGRRDLSATYATRDDTARAFQKRRKDLQTPP